MQRKKKAGVCEYMCMCAHVLKFCCLVIFSRHFVSKESWCNQDVLLDNDNGTASREDGGDGYGMGMGMVRVEEEQRRGIYPRHAAELSFINLCYRLNQVHKPAPWVNTCWESSRCGRFHGRLQSLQYIFCTVTTHMLDSPRPQTTIKVFVFIEMLLPRLKQKQN